MRVDRVYKGALKKTIELFEDNCGGLKLEVGRQYLMYTYTLGKGPLPAGGCTRSRTVEDAREDLAFLDLYSARKTATRIFGTIRFRPDDPDDEREERTTLRGVRVTLSSAGREFHATTDVAGRYSISGLPQGEYEIAAELPNYHVDGEPDEITLHAYGCVQADLLMMADRRVAGIVRNENGSVVDGALVEMIRTDRLLKPWEQPILRAISDDDGSYVLEGIPQGEYYLGVNIKSTPTKQRPHPRTYYPGTTDINQAATIKIVNGAAAQKFDLRIAGRLPLVEIQGRVLTADGKSPIGKGHPQVRFKGFGLFGQIEQEAIKIDAEGRFHFELCEGVRYSAFAVAGLEPSADYSAPIEFIPTKENTRLELILDKTGEEFRKLSNAMEGRD
jgi:hypothetical protein